MIFHVLERCTILQFTTPMKNIIVLHTTVENIDDARKIAQELLDLKLIACAQIDGPLESMYRWKNSIQTEKEYRLSVKSTDALSSQVIDKMKALHPYEVPEIVGQPLRYCLEEYQNWVGSEVSDVAT